jgi:predicted Zn-dependent peptidase
MKIRYFLGLLIFLQGVILATDIKSINIKGVDVPVIYEKGKLPLFSLQLVFKGGGYSYDGKLLGLAKLSSSILNEGTKTLGAVEFSKKLELKAIELSSSNGFETGVITVESLKEYSKDSISYLKELLKDPNYTKETIKKIKTIQIANITKDTDNFDKVAKNSLKKILFKDTPFSNDQKGSIDSVSSIKLKDIKTFHKKVMNLNNLVLVVGGDVEFDKIKTDILNLLEIFDVGKESEIKSFQANNKPKEKIIYKDTKQAYIYFGAPFYIDNQDDIYKSKILSFVIGASGFGSRLMEEIRVKRGLAYSAYGYVQRTKSVDFFIGYLQTKLQNQDKAKQLVVQTIEKFIKDGITQDELTMAKQYLMGSEPLKVETMDQRLYRAFILYYNNLPQNYPSEELNRIQNISLDDINRYIKSHKEILKLSFAIVTKENEEKQKK